MPSSLLLKSELFSSCKHQTTLKGSGRNFTKGVLHIYWTVVHRQHIRQEMVGRSGFLNLRFSTGDSIMADKSFTIEDILPLGIP